MASVPPRLGPCARAAEAVRVAPANAIPLSARRSRRERVKAASLRRWDLSQRLLARHGEQRNRRRAGQVVLRTDARESGRVFRDAGSLSMRDGAAQAKRLIF